MFAKNTLTFNPGWDQNGDSIHSFTDVRDLQRSLKSKGFELVSEVEENGFGPASFMVLDPDRNPILIDQHADLKNCILSQPRMRTTEHD